ncbi:MAG: NAD-dependent epimerase/dehydratase family protein [Proteobacteria bacterium]|nr:NAD-dependent epimerase/dehydratase family protein [Pseudomonadota bacterium]
MNNNNPQTALVTGATGFLGKHLCQKLVDQGWQVYALCRSPQKAQELNSKVHIIIGDILSPEAFTNQLPHNIDGLFHTAASTNTWFKNNELQTRTNIQGTKNMLAVAKQIQVKRYIHISSIVVYGMHSTLKNVVETLPKLGNESFINYVKTKTASEKIVLNTKNLNTVIINPTQIIGPCDKHNWARLIKMIAENKLPSIPNGSGSFVDVRDVAAGIIQAYHHGEEGNNYLLGGTDMSFNEFVNKIASKLNVQATKVQLPNFLLMALAKMKNLISNITHKEPDITPESVAIISDLFACDAAKARRELNYQTRDFAETLNDTIVFLKYHQKHHPTP